MFSKLKTISGKLIALFAASLLISSLLSCSANDVVSGNSINTAAAENELESAGFNFPEKAVETYPEATLNDAAKGSDQSATRYLEFADEKEGMCFQYPDTWFLFDMNLLVENADYASEKTGIKPHLLSQVLKASRAVLYDITNHKGNFLPDIRYATETAHGTLSEHTSERSIQLTINGVNKQMDGFRNVAWMLEPEKRTFGGQDYLYFVISYNQAGETIVIRQASTIHNWTMYYFTCSDADKDVDTHNQDVFHSILETVSFK